MLDVSLSVITSGQRHYRQFRSVCLAMFCVFLDFFLSISIRERERERDLTIFSLSIGLSQSAKQKETYHDLLSCVWSLFVSILSVF